jgi:hypothetical protein
LYGLVNYIDGWSISFATSFNTISQTVSNNLPLASGLYDEYTIISDGVTSTGYGEIVTFGSGSGFDSGDLYYLNSSGTWVKADASAAVTSTGMLAIALGSSPTSGMLIKGFYNTAFSLTIGDEVYISSSTAGDMTATAPSGAGDVVRIVGYCIDSATDTIYFNPSNDWIEL